MYDNISDGKVEKEIFFCPESKQVWDHLRRSQLDLNVIYFFPPQKKTDPVLMILIFG